MNLLLIFESPTVFEFILLAVLLNIVFAVAYFIIKGVRGRMK